MTGRSKVVSMGLIGLVLFGLGLWGGYWCWGRASEPTDYRQLLLRVANYMDSLEQQNSNLNDKLAGLERKLEQDKPAAPEQANELQNLRAENARLRSGLELDNELKRLRAENQALRTRLDPVQP